MELFDLTKRVEAGLHFLNHCVDIKRGGLPYFAVMFKKDPAEARHDWPDFGDLTGRYVEAFAQARRVLGDLAVGDVEAGLRKLLLSYFNEGDGLSYRPVPGKPYYSTIFRREYAAHVAEGFDQARVLWALLAWYEETGDPAVLRRLEELIAGLDCVMVKKGDFGYYDRATFEPGVHIAADAAPMPHQFYFCGTQIHPLIECWRRLGLEKALDLARRLSSYIVDRSDYFLDDGQWNCPGGAGFESAEMDGHTHSRFATIAGIVTVGLVTGQAEKIERMKRAYDWFYTHHCSSFGWSPEFLGRFGSENEGCETCAVMDHINAALALAEAGYAEYYQHAERFGRNQLMENQLLDTSLVRNTVRKDDTDLSCFHNVAQMVRGGFAGWAGPNDFIGNCDHHYCLMNCCGPAGIRAIHDLWKNSYTIRNNDIYVNLYFDHDDGRISIKNRQPQQGLLEILPRVSGTLYLAKRTWLEPKHIKLTVGQMVRPVAERPDSIEIGVVNAGEPVRVEFPLLSKTEVSHVNGRHYTVAWRGDTVVDIDPKGTVMPLYQNRKR